MGVEPGPTLAVSAAMHGQELIGSIAIGQLLRELDPTRLRGQLIAVPVVNTAAFEFSQRATYWDGKDLNRQGRGRLDGSITERLAFHYFEDIVARSDALIDIHSGGPDSYYYYTIYLSEVPDHTFDKAVVQKSREMALAFGMEHIFGKTPWRGTLKEEAMKAGIPSITIEMGGGADFFRNGTTQIANCLRGITNVMKLLGMLDGEIFVEAPAHKVWNAHTEIIAGEEPGFLLRQAQWGDYLSAGDIYAMVYHPYTGEELTRITAPRAGTVLNSSTVWPPIPAHRWLAVLGDLMEEVPTQYPRVQSAAQGV
jgi:predicted deacylase